MNECRGRFCWHDLMADDSATAAAFYGAVMAMSGGGWIVRGTDPHGAAFALHGTSAATKR